MIKLLLRSITLLIITLYCENIFSQPVYIKSKNEIHKFATDAVIFSQILKTEAGKKTALPKTIERENCTLTFTEKGINRNEYYDKGKRVHFCDNSTMNITAKGNALIDKVIFMMSTPSHVSYNEMKLTYDSGEFDKKTYTYKGMTKSIDVEFITQTYIQEIVIYYRGTDNYKYGDVIWEEHFKRGDIKFSDGGTNLNKDNIEQYTDLKGWDVKNAKCPTGYITVGASRNSGYIITPELNFEGDVYLTFKAGALASNDNTQLKISVNGAGKTDIPMISMLDNAATNYTIKIQGVKKDTRIKFSNAEKEYNRFSIDDVIVYKSIEVENIELDENIDNSEVINAYNGKDVCVKLKRTLEADGGWYTFCVPFSISNYQIKEIFSDADIQKFDDVFIDKDNVAEIRFVKTEDIIAGVPYLIKPAKTISEPIFDNVNIDTSANTTTEHKGYKFVGIYSPYKIPAEKKYRFLGGETGNELITPVDDGSFLKGLRAYFIYDTDNLNGAKISIDKTTESGIEHNIWQTDNKERIYDISGRCIYGYKTSLKKGIYIYKGKKMFIK